MLQAAGKSADENLEATSILGLRHLSKLVLCFLPRQQLGRLHFHMPGWLHRGKPSTGVPDRREGDRGCFEPAVSHSAGGF